MFGDELKAVDCVASGSRYHYGFWVTIVATRIETRAHCCLRSASYAKASDGALRRYTLSRPRKIFDLARIILNPQPVKIMSSTRCLC